MRLQSNRTFNEAIFIKPHPLLDQSLLHQIIDHMSNDITYRICLCDQNCPAGWSMFQEILESYVRSKFSWLLRRRFDVFHPIFLRDVRKSFWKR
ncbi:hypothetical protein AJ81_08920 [Pseudothermotoga hypogea DSM 11164 = NBRC 106472]|uniref:Uncharacterized protein n=1 Tax=Pseudothermotoga hypogea DSM 11164 = NBRC 106472 TaxID=1123384 RepID=A0A0X1KU83_9THEM|nr:hypothetical protein AJ81_08920 [Pseudothermotoga hypogea DSM 11164 = NBRC 106472]